MGKNRIPKNENEKKQNLEKKIKQKLGKNKTFFIGPYF